MDPNAAKADLRRRLRAARLERQGAARDAAAAGLLRAAVQAGLLEARAVAAYLPMPSEPDVEPLLNALDTRGSTVVVPAPRADRTLAWGYFTEEHVVHGKLPVRQPVDPGLGVGAAALVALRVEVVLVPALAVASDGMRLGQGGGYYDRMLADLPPSVMRVGVVFTEEFLANVPGEAHDARMTAVLTPDGLIRVL